MAPTTWLPSPLLLAHVPRTKDLERAQNANPMCDTMRVYMQVETELWTSYLGVLIRFRLSVHVPISVRGRSGKGVNMHFKSPVEVLLFYLPDNDSACKRTDYVTCKSLHFLRWTSVLIDILCSDPISISFQTQACYILNSTPRDSHSALLFFLYLFFTLFYNWRGAFAIGRQ